MSGPRSLPEPVCSVPSLVGAGVALAAAGAASGFVVAGLITEGLLRRWSRQEEKHQTWM